MAVNEIIDTGIRDSYYGVQEEACRETTEAARSIREVTNPSEITKTNDGRIQPKRLFVAKNGCNEVTVAQQDYKTTRIS